MCAGPRFAVLKSMRAGWGVPFNELVRHVSQQCEDDPDHFPERGAWFNNNQDEHN
jgi:hypothetical protein